MTTGFGPYPLSGVRMPTWLLRFDKHGACASPGTRANLLDQLRVAPPTDVILFSHGWNEDFDSATAMYAEFLRNFEAQCVAHPLGRPFEPLFVGVVWPSIWLSFESGPTIASGPDDGGQVNGLLSALAERIVAAGGVGVLERLYALLAAPAIDDADAAELARLIAPAFGVVADEGAAAEGRSTVADDVLAMMHAMELAQPDAQPLQSDDIFNFSRPAGAVHSDATRSGARMAGLANTLDPRHALRLFSLYQMKDRAGTVGYNGVAALLREVLASPDDGSETRGPLRLHAVGHSFGCKVLLSAICAQPLPRPVSSLLLLQPAISHLCFSAEVPGTSKPGGYIDALSAERVSPPIVSTYSRRDVPLHDAFHVAVRRASDLGEAQIAAGAESTSAGSPPSRFAALGGYGPRHANEALVDPLPSAGIDFSLPSDPHPVVAFDGSQGLIKGHGDITGSAVTWILHKLVARQ